MFSLLVFNTDSKTLNKNILGTDFSGLADERLENIFRCKCSKIFGITYKTSTTNDLHPKDM